MCPCQMLYDGEAQSSAAQIPRPGAINSIKALEQSIQMLGGNSFARVCDTYEVKVISLMVDCDCSTFTIEFRCVVDKIGDHLHEAMWIGKNFDILCDLILQRDSSLGRSN